MNLYIEKWKEFPVERLFNISAGNYYSSDDYDEGTTPYVSASSAKMVFGK